MSMRINGAAALCIATYAVKRNNVSVITDTFDGVRSLIGPALNNVLRSWLARADLVTGRLIPSLGLAIKGVS